MYLSLKFVEKWDLKCFCFCLWNNDEEKGPDWPGLIYLLTSRISLLNFEHKGFWCRSTAQWSHRIHSQPGRLPCMKPQCCMMGKGNYREATQRNSEKRETYDVRMKPGVNMRGNLKVDGRTWPGWKRRPPAGLCWSPGQPGPQIQLSHRISNTSNSSIKHWRSRGSTTATSSTRRQGRDKK